MAPLSRIESVALARKKHHLVGIGSQPRLLLAFAAIVVFGRI